jgi:L-threonylcarbamoyladenylate synthase
VTDQLTPDQEQWIAHLSDVDRIHIVPFDRTAAARFDAVKGRIQSALGPDTIVEHHGATSLGISGQDEIDVYVPVAASQFDAMVESLRALFGPPRSHYPSRRARFAVDVDGKHVDVFPINQDHSDWHRLNAFEAYLRSHPNVLARYRDLKEAGDGLTVRKYYRRKTVFFNEILAAAAEGQHRGGHVVSATSGAAMRPNVVHVDPNHPEPAVIERAAAVIRHGGLVAFPTETVYGLGANALDEAAVRSIFAAKRRALDDPLIVHIASVDELPTVVAEVPPVARALAARFWPGPLTIVLPKASNVPDLVTAGLPTVAVRVPSHPVAQALIRATGVPVAAPSANLFTRTSATTADHVVEDLGDRVDLILDGGPAPHGIESTVVAIHDAEVRLLRPGATTPEALADALSALEPPVPLLLGAVGRSASPGLMAKHYSPRASLFLLTGDPSETRPALRRAVERALNARRRVGLLLVDEDAPLFEDLADRIETIRLGSESDLSQVGVRLFAAMRSLDASGCDAIYARSLGTSGLGLAILDRLTRAAHSGGPETLPNG